MLKPFSLSLLALACSTSLFSSIVSAEPLVIAHRGASGYLPEHTLEAKTLAYAMKPDYIEQDVVMTKDDQLVVLHDHYLDRVTDVAERFPNRARADGRYYAIDFTLAEIKTCVSRKGLILMRKVTKSPAFLIVSLFGKGISLSRLSQKKLS